MSINFAEMECGYMGVENTLNISKEKLLEEVLQLYSAGGEDEFLQKLSDYINEFGICDVSALLYANALSSGGDIENAIDICKKGLLYNPYNYELYYSLADYYIALDEYNCAAVCLEMADFHCNNNDKALIKAAIENQKQLFANKENITAICFMDDNIALIKLFVLTLKLYQNIDIMIFGASFSKEVDEFCKINNVMLFEGGGAQCAALDAALNYCKGDVLLFSKNERPCDNMLFNLRLALYENDDHAAMLATDIDNEDRITYSEYEINKCAFVHSGAMLIRHDAFAKAVKDKVEYKDLVYFKKHVSLLALEKNKYSSICSFAFSVCMDEKTLNEADENKFYERFSVRNLYSTHARTDIIDLMTSPPRTEINVLEIGCAAGATLLEIQKKYKRAKLYGIEIEQAPAKIAAKFADVRNDDITKGALPWQKSFFDYIIIGDVLEHLYDPRAVLEGLAPYIENSGSIIVSLPNVMHYSVVIPLLQGNWHYEDAGILDRTHLRFFTKKEIIELFENAKYDVLDINNKIVGFQDPDTNAEKLIDGISQLLNTDKTEYLTYQYLVVAKPKK